MRTLLALSALVLFASAASAREVEETSAPARTVAKSAPQAQGPKRDANVPAKYDMAYRVRDVAPLLKDRGAI